jgi:hypothetical protein
VVHNDAKLTAERVGEEANHKSCDREKAYPSLNHSILSVVGGGEGGTVWSQVVHNNAKLTV